MVRIKAKVKTARFARYLLIIFFALVVMLLPAYKNTFAATIQPYTIEELITTTMRTQNVPGVSAAVIRGENTTFYTQGLACRKSLAPVDPYTFFYIASISKGFTALGVQLLVHKGYLCLLDPVAKHIPWFYFNFRSTDFSVQEITVQHLLHHTSGLGFFTHSAAIRPLDAPNALYQSVRFINGTSCAFVRELVLSTLQAIISYWAF